MPDEKRANQAQLRNGMKAMELFKLLGELYRQGEAGFSDYGQLQARFDAVKKLAGNDTEKTIRLDEVDRLVREAQMAARTGSEKAADEYLEQLASADPYYADVEKACFEIYGSHEFTQQSWDKLIQSGRCKPCGLGCRDTLRFEVGLPLYGDELSADISPVMAGLSMFCKLDKPEFIGKEALAEQKANGVAQKLVGIELADKAIPRHGYAVLNADGEPVGEVTTGYHCLSVDKSVCMALVKTEYAKLDTPLAVQIRKKVFPGTVVKKKFYDKHYKK